MRSPQFLQAMKDCMEQAINFRRLTTDWMAKVRNDLQAPSREDGDNIMIATRHMEKRVLDRIEQLGNEVKALRAALEQRSPSRPQPRTKRPAGRKSTRNVRV